jgi:hypothetical protein
MKRSISLKRWWVYTYNPKQQRHAEVGYVMARHAPDALLRAFKKWPDKCDEKQVQAGFIVRRERI